METITKKLIIKEPFTKEEMHYVEEELKKEIYLEASQKLPNNNWFTVKYRSKVEKDFVADPLSPTYLIGALTIQPTQHEYVKTVVPVFVTYKEHKGFWKKLKLLFSKKSVYTEE